jgi:hypothetical protein
MNFFKVCESVTGFGKRFSPSPADSTPLSQIEKGASRPDPYYFLVHEMDIACGLKFSSPEHFPLP